RGILIDIEAQCAYGIAAHFPDAVELGAGAAEAGILLSPRQVQREGMHRPLQVDLRRREQLHPAKGPVSPVLESLRAIPQGPDLPVNLICPQLEARAAIARPLLAQPHLDGLPRPPYGIDAQSTDQLPAHVEQPSPGAESSYVGRPDEVERQILRRS